MSWHAPCTKFVITHQQTRQTMTQQNSLQHVEITVQFNEEEITALTKDQLQSLEALLKAQKSRLTHFVRKNLRREDFVDDIIQQTHMAAFRNWGGFRGESKTETWLFDIALNLVKNFQLTKLGLLSLLQLMYLRTIRQHHIGFLFDLQKIWDN